jgi:large conductance mechanosensitive channel
MLKGFREFIMRGNVMDLAVAVVIGTAFTAVVKSLVTNVINQLLAAIVHKPDFSALHFSLNGTDIAYGAFLNDLIEFLLIAAAVYFFMVAPMNAWKARMGILPPRKCPECLSEIPSGARRCAHCTSLLTAKAA